MVYQLVYGSTATVEFDEPTLLELLQGARKNNDSLGVTGMLLYAEGAFLQVLEGEREAVEALFGKIEGDARHTGTRVLLKAEVEERAFEDWSMGFHYATSLAALPEGLSSFMQHGARNDQEAGAARRALSAFRDGRWRESA